jgi:protein associated with RNAse G/E
LESRDDKVIILRATATTKRKVDDFIIDRGDQIRQYFPFNEWFYIQEYLDSHGRTKGWYRNISTPAEIKGSSITCRDLILDIFVDGKRNVRILDEDELDKKRDLIPESTIARINHARKKLVEMIEKRMPPFRS